MIAKDQEVPIIATSSAAAALSGNYTFEFQSLEMEAESELAQIETMLSMFDDIPATTCTSSGKDMSQDTDTTTRTVLDVQSQGQSSDREQSLKQMVVTDKVSSGDRCSGGRVTGGGDDMDIESILQEMNTIDGESAVA